MRTAPDVFLPLMMQPTVMPSFENLLDKPIVNRSWVQAIVRTRPGVTPDQAAATMNAAQQSQQDLQGRAPQGGGADGPSLEDSADADGGDVVTSSSSSRGLS